MKIREVLLSGISKLQSRSYVCEFGGTPAPYALILEFTGEYGYGSLGNEDAAYMEAIKSAWLSYLHTDAVVFDLRQLEYQFGNSIWNVFHWGGDIDDDDDNSDGYPRKEHPTALVVSDLCRPGFLTCEKLVPQMFTDLDDALRFVEIPARKHLEKLNQWLGNNSIK